MKYVIDLRLRVARCLLTSKLKNEKLFSVHLMNGHLYKIRDTYININIHSKESFWDLGLARIRGRFSAEKCSSAEKCKCWKATCMS